MGEAAQAESQYWIIAIIVVLVLAMIIVVALVGGFVHCMNVHKKKVEQGLFLAGAISNKWRSNKKNVSIVPEMSKKVNEDWLTDQSKKANEHDLRVGYAL